MLQHGLCPSFINSLCSKAAAYITHNAPRRKLQRSFLSKSTPQVLFALFKCAVPSPCWLKGHPLRQFAESARLFLKLQNTLKSNSRLVPPKINRDSRVILLKVFLVNLSTEWLDLIRYKIAPYIGVDTSEGRTWNTVSVDCGVSEPAHQHMNARSFPSCHFNGWKKKRCSLNTSVKAYSRPQF